MIAGTRRFIHRAPNTSKKLIPKIQEIQALNHQSDTMESTYKQILVIPSLSLDLHQLVLVMCFPLCSLHHFLSTMASSQVVLLVLPPYRIILLRELTLLDIKAQSSEQHLLNSLKLAPLPATRRPGTLLFPFSPVSRSTKISHGNASLSRK